MLKGIALFLQGDFVEASLQVSASSRIRRADAARIELAGPSSSRSRPDGEALSIPRLLDQGAQRLKADDHDSSGTLG
jgi:hypothetical protein